MVDSIFKSDRVRTPVFQDIFVAIDPASHNSSCMGICAIGIHEGLVYLMGLASVRLERADVLQIHKTIVRFLERLREHPAAKKAVMLPIIEVNGNEPYAATLSQAFQESPPFRNPFTRNIFKSKVSVGIGVWTTRETKFASIKEGKHDFACSFF